MHYANCCQILNGSRYCTVHFRLSCLRSRLGPETLLGHVYRAKVGNWVGSFFLVQLPDLVGSATVAAVSVVCGLSLKETYTASFSDPLCRVLHPAREESVEP